VKLVRVVLNRMIKMLVHFLFSDVLAFIMLKGIELVVHDLYKPYSNCDRLTLFLTFSIVGFPPMKCCSCKFGSVTYIE
jgi:hypothetical protein